MPEQLPFHLLFEAAPDAIVLTDASSGVIVSANAQASSLLGYSREELQGRRWDDFMVGDTQSQAEAPALVELHGGHTWRGEINLVGQQERVLVCEAAASGIEDQGAHIVQWRFTDATEAKIAELRVRKTEKIEALSRFSARVALEFEEVLTAVSVLPDVLPALRTDPHAGAKDADAAWRKASWLLSQLGTFGRLQAQQLQATDINVCLGPLEDLLKQEAGRFVEIQFALEASPGLIRADPGQLKQILLRLCRNAIEAMSRSGVLTVETATKEVTGVTAQQLGVEPGLYVSVVVSDTGKGFDDKIWTHLFEPFFSTKVTESDHGLDLSAVHGLVKQNGGVIWVSSDSSHGTTFRLLFPRIEHQPDQLQTQHLTLPAGKGSETVLVVDERDGIRTLMRNVLKRKGYSVLEAVRPGDALKLCRSHHGPIHLLLAHLASPQRAQDFAEAFTQMKPELRLLYLLGTANGASDAASSPVGAAFLQEPFQLDELLPKVREVLDSSR